ncbi:MAG: hypothetical protein O7E57_05235 [Gammaproteobacteria bacterium]|nr:hypothetical protein [Gammaproteobacteria bacterium]
MRTSHVADRWAFGTILVAGIIICATTYASEAIERFSEVAANTPAVDESRCSYTTISTSASEEDVLEERFTADEDDAWRLVKVNGMDPNAEEIEAYADAARQRDRRNHPLAFDLQKLAQMDSLRMSSEDADTVTFTFLLRPDEERENQEFLEKMLGKLIVSKTEHRPVLFILESAKPFSPAPTFKIKEFRQEMRFQYDGTLSTSVVVEIKSHFLAKAFIFKTIKDDRVVKFSDYTCR